MAAVAISHGYGYSTYGTGLYFWSDRMLEFLILFALGMVVGWIVVWWWKG